MEFLKYLKNRYSEKTINSMRLAYKQVGLDEFELPQMSNGICFNKNIILSVQGSSAHYCQPRKTLHYKQHKRMEFAIIINKEFVDVKRIIDTNRFDDYFDGSVYGYVPVEDIEWLFQELKNKFGLKE